KLAGVPRDSADQLDRRVIVVVDRGGYGVDVDDRPAHIGVPQLRVVFHRVITDGDDDVGVREDDVTGLGAEKPAPAEVVRLEFAGDHPGGLECLDHREIGVGDELVQRGGD